MTRTRKSRREFMRLLAAGTAAALAAPAATLAAAAKSSTKPPAKAAPAKSAPASAKGTAADSARLARARTEAAGGHAADPAEIEKQKKYTADTLKTLREFSLPPGSPMAFSFRPLKARRARRTS